jgi:hypothetical protein
MHQYVSFLTKEVAECLDGVWAIGKVQCIHCLLTYLDNFAIKRHKGDTT